ncbi:HMA2 domain-containing protein, partial [Sorangium cellulosum]|uniref:HMA2 domain-containing protein n=1 Tax=Sorangium cellulosum TaxID=56 RepID=UPI003B969B91
MMAALPSSGAGPLSVVASVVDSAGGVDVVHAIPGRVRLRLPRLRRDAAFGPLLEAGLIAVPGVLSVRLAEGAASAVVEHDPRQADLAAIVR